MPKTTRLGEWICLPLWTAITSGACSAKCNKHYTATCSSIVPPSCSTTWKTTAAVFFKRVFAFPCRPVCVQSAHSSGLVRLTRHCREVAPSPVPPREPCSKIGTIPSSTAQQRDVSGNSRYNQFFRVRFRYPQQRTGVNFPTDRPKSEPGCDKPLLPPAGPWLPAGQTSMVRQG
jgi:hypothetical protein